MPNTLIWIPKRLVELGLVNVAARSPEAFIDYCEQDYAARVEHAAACVRESGAHVVMLTGPSASGKTTTAHKLADCIAAHGRRSAVVSLDNFYKDLKDYPRLPDGSVDYESVDALDISAINRCLLELIRTGRTQIPDFDFCGERRRHGVIPVEVGDGVVVIEGIHALNPRLTALLPEGSAFKIYAGMREEYSRAVSYTHLDVYKRQMLQCAGRHPRHVPSHSQPLQGLYLHTQAQYVPVAAHDGHRT